MMGRVGKDAATYIIGALGLPLTEDEWMQLTHDEYERVMPDAEIIPGNCLSFSRFRGSLQERDSQHRTPFRQGLHAANNGKGGGHGGKGDGQNSNPRNELANQH